MWILITVLWLSPIGYITTGESGLTLEECEQRMFESIGEARCINDK